MSFLSTPKETVRRPPGRPITEDLLQLPRAPQIVRDQPNPPAESQFTETPHFPIEPQFAHQPQSTSEFQFFSTNGATVDNQYPFCTGFDYAGDLFDIDLEFTRPFPSLGHLSTLETTPVDPALSSIDSQFPTSPQTTTQPQAFLATESSFSSASQVAPQDQPQPVIEGQPATLYNNAVQSPVQPTPAQESAVASEDSLNQAPPAPPAPAKRTRKRNVSQVAGTADSGEPATKKKKAPAKSKAKPKGNPKAKSKEGLDENSQEKPNETPQEKPKTDYSNIVFPESYSKIHQARKGRHQRWRTALAEHVEQQEAQAQITLNEYSKAHPIDLTGEDLAGEQSATMSTENHPQGVPASDQPVTFDQSVAQPVAFDPQQQDPALQTQDPAIRPPGYFFDDDVRRKLKIGRVTLLRAGLGLPNSLDREEIHRRLSFIEAELNRQQGKAPILPPSELTQPGPKPFTPKAYHVPSEIDDPRVRRFFAKKNHDLCTKNKQIDLDRNNQAAKGTRHRREEALNKYRDLANAMAIELNWWRLKAVSLGADHREWDRVPETVRKIMADEMSERVQRLEGVAAREAKKQRSAIHSARTSENARLSKEDEARKKQEILEVAAAYAAEDHAELERLADPNYRATIPESPSTAADRNTTANGQTPDPKENASVVDQGTKTGAAPNMTMALATDGMAETTNTADATSAMNPDNIFGFGNSSQVTPAIVPVRFHVTAPPMYSGIVLENPQLSDFLNPPDITPGNVQTQGHQPSDLRQEVSDYQELRRKSSNVTMIDAQPDTVEAPPQFDTNVQSMVNEPPYWTPSNTFSPSPFLPNMSNTFQGPLEDASSLPPNNMNHNIHGPLGSPGLLPNNVNQNSDDLLFNIPWFGEEDTLGSSSLSNTFLTNHQNNGNQNETLTNNTGSSDRFDINADPSTYPDPVEQCFFDQWLKNPDSPS